MNFLATVNHFLHLACVVFWMGGIAFQLLIAAPFLRSDQPPPHYLITLSNRFQKAVSPVIFILIVTGGMNIGFRRAGHEAFPPGYISVLGIKILLVAAVTSIHFFGIICLQKNNLAEENQERPELPMQSYASLTLVIGIIIIFIATLLRHWAF